MFWNLMGAHAETLGHRVLAQFCSRLQAGEAKLCGQVMRS
jgi:hypothetical protein